MAYLADVPARLLTQCQLLALLLLFPFLSAWVCSCRSLLRRLEWTLFKETLRTEELPAEVAVLELSHPFLISTAIAAGPLFQHLQLIIFHLLTPRKYPVVGVEHHVYLFIDFYLFCLGTQLSVLLRESLTLGPWQVLHFSKLFISFIHQFKDGSWPVDPILRLWCHPS